MSDENLAVVREFVELWSGKDLVAMTAEDPGAIEAMMAFLTDDVELQFEATVEQRTNYGPNASMRALMEWLEPWEEYVQEAQEFIDADATDTVVVTFRQWGRGKASGATTEMHVAQLYRVRDGKISELREFTSRDEALEAAGASATGDADGDR